MQNSFDPDEIALFRRAIETVCTEMRGCDAEIETYIAHRIICRAQLGDWDYYALISAARLNSPLTPCNETALGPRGVAGTKADCLASFRYAG